MFDGIKYKTGSVGISKTIDKMVQLSSTREHSIAIYNKESKFDIDTQEKYTIAFSIKRESIADNSNKLLSGDYYVFS